MNKIERFLTNEQMSEYKEVFALFDKNCDGVITTKQFGTIMRSIGANPTEAQIRYLFDKYKVVFEGTIDFYVFLQMITNQHNNIDEQIFEACKQFDQNGTGIISVDDFKRALVTLGEEITENDFNEIIEKGKQNEQINYIEIVEKLFAQ